MSIRAVLVPLLVARFPDRGLRLGEPPDPVAVFPGVHPEVGEIRISDANNSADLAVGNIVYDHFFNPYDEERGTDKAVEGIANDVVRFLEELFADRLLMWRSVDGRTRGWRERGEAAHSAPLVIDDREYSCTCGRGRSACGGRHLSSWRGDRLWMTASTRSWCSASTMTAPIGFRCQNAMR